MPLRDHNPPLGGVCATCYATDNPTAPINRLHKIATNGFQKTKRFGRTITSSACYRVSVARRMSEYWTPQKLVTTVFIGLVLVQIPLFLMVNRGRSKSDQGIEEGSEARVLVKRLSEEVWNRAGNGIPEERYGERRIKSYKDDSMQHKEDNKIRYNRRQQQNFEDYPGNSKSLKALEPTLAVPARSLDEGKSRDTGSKPLCPIRPPDLSGRLSFHFNDTPPTFSQVADNNPNLRPGGFFRPHDCEARYRVAFIIPHRARELHLRALLWHLHPIFQRQQLYYKIYVVHQAGNLAFNKAKLMNIGFLEALKEDNYDCVVFHDVDLLPEDDRLLYTCNETPKHLSVAIDKYGYRLPYTSLFGGVTMLSIDQFKDVNGYSNMYWGWGGEDDDMFNRIFSRGYTIKRPPFHIARYKMSFHHRDKGNRLNLMRYEILSRSINRMQEDGLNNVKYTIKSVEETPIYTNVTADVGTAVVQCKPYLSDWTCSFVLWMCEYLTMSCGLLQYNSTDDGTLAMPMNTQILR